MADDPDRDILPVKDGSCSVDTCRSNIGILDPRERHIVSKLDRYQLGDRYLRLLEETHSLKKLSNSQEDKIKRLATKLMRVSANPGACTVALNAYDDKNKITVLELENSKLKEKISVLRNQLLNHTLVGRSSSRSGRPPFTRPSSGLITCRSESSRMRTPSCQCIVRGNEDNDTQNYLVKIEELEMQKKDLTCRITQLEKELTNYAVGNQREKIAENVEYIRVCRQMKQLNDKLLAAQDTNDSLNAQINDLKRTLDETTKNNQETTTALIAEKKRAAEMDEQVLKAKESQLTLREKEEHIRDLTNEMKILQQHNSELIALSSKYGQIESENVELKKKISEQLCDQQNLRSAFNTDQTNIAALQAANEQLLNKLHELQKNMDTLTIRLTTFQNQKDKSEDSPVQVQAPAPQSEKKTPDKKEERNFYGQVATQVEKCKKCCEAYEKILHLEKVVSTGRIDAKAVDKNVQTDRPPEIAVISTKDQATSTCIPNGGKDESPTSKQKEPETKMESPLSREKMLKLLEQAQISTPMDAARIGQKAEVGNSSEYDGIIDANQRHRDADKHPEEPKRRICWEIEREKENNDDDDTPASYLRILDRARLKDPNKILNMFFDIFQEYSSMFSAANSLANGFEHLASVGLYAYEKRDAADTDVKTRKFSKKRSRPEQFLPEDATAPLGCASKKFCSSSNKRGAQIPKDKIVRKTRVTAFTQTDSCNCTLGKKCYPDSDCGYQCCSYLPQPISSRIANEDCQDINTVVVGAWENGSEGTAFKNVVQNEEKLCDAVAHQLNKCRDLLNDNCKLDDISETSPSLSKKLTKQGEPVVNLEREIESSCSLKCPNDCVETSSASDTFPLLIMDGQGLVEIHIVSVQLSTSAPHILFRESNISNISVFLSWHIWEQEPAFTPALECPKLNFNSSFVYRIPDLFKFFYCVLSEYVVFHVNVVQQNETTYEVARAKLCIKDILDYPQNKLYYITPVNSIVPCSLGMNFGQLSLWVRLSCDIDKVEAFKKQCGIISRMGDPQPKQKTTKKRAVRKTASVEKHPDSETAQDLFVLKDHNLDLIMDASEDTLVHRSSISDQSTSLKCPLLEEQHKQQNYPRDEPFYEAPDKEYKQGKTFAISKNMDIDEDTSEDEHSRLKLEHAMKTKLRDEGDTQDFETQAETASMKEFNALLANSKDLSTRGSSSTIFDMSEVLSDAKWNEYKRRSRLHSGVYRSETPSESLDDEIERTWDFPLEKDTIVIEIVNVTLFHKSPVMSDDEISLIYVEYSFLGHRGADMETVSVEKPKTPGEKMTYNFKKHFHVDEKSHAVERNTLRAMLEESINPNIKFVLVSEPVPEETDIKECVEIGVAFFNIREYALGDGYKNVPLPVMNSAQTQQIGILKLFILGLDAIRQCLGDNS